MSTSLKIIKVFLWFALLTGVIYPLLITLIASIVVRDKAKGSFITLDGKVVGSKLIGQHFTSENYFWSRPSAINYQPLPSLGSHLGPTSAILKNEIEKRKSFYGNAPNIPSELLYASGSGLDPHISVKAAYFQMERVAKSRGIEEQKIKSLIDEMAENSYINVLLLNIALDESKP